ncbi:uncharacterized protein LOC131607461 isoform X2 [Vicia villosa]|uniref:uncharacterized protein LOC131607461 isoform X2 n=1 Tax=Vicia villosa TaxID=3911 RepID=UPI00273CDF0A|nr:uncharacterized protein LOC131607461 isoform X2 [Vicia villosa]
MVVSQNDEIPIGWPFGLGILNMRLRVVEALPANVSAEPYSLSLHIPSASFSSVSSSNLDTESTASFFKDNSVSLGHLIGIRPGDRKRLYFPNPLKFEEKENKPLAKVSCSNDTSKSQEVDMSCGVCVPSLLDPLLIKISKSKKNSRN